MLKQSDKNRVIFFDGYCNLCSFSIDLISAKNTESSFTFVPLQSKLALGLLTQNGYSVEKIKTLENVVYLRRGQLMVKSDAILAILFDLGGIYRLSYVLYLLPTFIRNEIYNFIAKKRYQWFGKRQTCKLPVSDQSQEE